MSKPIFLDAPLLGDIEKKYLNDAVDSGFVSTVGPFVPQFEESIAKQLSCPSTVAVQSGTAALHMALYEAGVGPGDEVIVPALTFVATVNPVSYVGAKAVVVDVDLDTWTIDIDKVRKSINKKTKAIIPVHLYGNPCNMDALSALAKEHDLIIIEDATESLGSYYAGKATASIGDYGCLSFNGNKMMTTGGGGIVVANNKKHLEHIRFLINQARDVEKGYYHPELGFNFRMTNIQAALGLAQLQRYNDFIEIKKRTHSLYLECLSSCSKITFQVEHDNASSIWWLTSVVFDDSIDVEALRLTLLNKGIQSRRFFMPVNEFPMYNNNKDGCHISKKLYEQGLCLPSSYLNSEDEIEIVCRAILKEIL